MKLSSRARSQLSAFVSYYARLQRPEAIRNVELALRMAVGLIEHEASLPAPRPYPELARDGEAWVHAGRYWFAHTTAKPVMIIEIYHDTADIPGRR